MFFIDRINYGEIRTPEQLVIVMSKFSRFLSATVPVRDVTNFVLQITISSFFQPLVLR